MYEGIKTAIGPIPSKTAPLKSAFGETIRDKEKQMERRVEHYASLYSRESITSDAILEVVERLTVMNELDESPSVTEISKAIDRLPTGKAQCPNGIRPMSSRTHMGVLSGQLNELLCQCWEEGPVPQDMRDCNIVTKTKDRSDCNNSR